MKLHGANSEELRQHALRYWIEPRAAAWMRADGRVQSVVAAVAQYWCDEAYDAVHLGLWGSTSPDPSWPALVQDGLGSVPEAVLIAAGGGETTWADSLDDNVELVQAFAAFCTADAHQELHHGDSYRPWAILRRDGDGVATEIVGKFLQESWEDALWRPGRVRGLRLSGGLQAKAAAGQAIPIERLLRAMDAAGALPEALQVGAELLRALRAWEQRGADPSAALQQADTYLSRLRYG